MIIRLFIALLVAVGMVGAGVAQETPPTEPTEPTQPTDADIVVPGGIPSVVMPVEDLLSTLWRNPGLIEFHSALMAAQVNTMVPRNEMFTIFAPTDAAVLGASDVMLTRDSLAYHVVRGAYSYADLWRMANAAGGSTTLTTLQGDDLTIEISGDTLRIEGQASITRANLPADNGFVHVISSLIQPTARIDLGG